MTARRSAILTGFLALIAACSPDAPVTAPTNLPNLAVHGSTQPWIVVFRDDIVDVDAAVAEVSGASRGAVQRVFRHTIKGFSVTLSSSAAAALARHPKVRYVEHDQEMYAIETQTGPTWGLDRIDQRSLPLNGSYTYNNTAAGVTVYIIDTGIRYDHQEFRYSATDTRSRATFGYDALGGNGSDCHGHGTHVAGTVGGLTYGVAKGVSLVAVRVLGCSGSGSTSGIISALDWIVSTHPASAPAVGNMSIGGGFSQSLNDAVTRAHNDGVSMAVAAGNSNIDACGYSPASTPAAITVGATGNNDARASFSNHGPCVDFFAPGVSITSAHHTSATAAVMMSGTSMASPHVAGAAALYAAANPGSTPTQIRDGLFALTTKGIVSSANSTNNHLLYTLGIGGATNQDPVAQFSYSCSALSCTFTDQSLDGDGSIASRSWDFGDGNGSSATNPSHTFASAGTYTVQLAVTDDDGASSSTSQNVTVTNTPTNLVLTSTTRTKGTNRVTLNWTGSAAANIDVYRNGTRIATVSNTGSYTDNLGKSNGTYTHQVCNAGTSTCSNTVTNTF